MTSSRPNTTEGVVELVQLPTVDVEHLEVVLGFEPQLTFSCQNLNIRKYQEQKEVPLVTIMSLCISPVVMIFGITMIMGLNVNTDDDN